MALGGLLGAAVSYTQVGTYTYVPPPVDPGYVGNGPSPALLARQVGTRAYGNNNCATAPRSAVFQSFHYIPAAIAKLGLTFWNGYVSEEASNTGPKNGTEQPGTSGLTYRIGIEYPLGSGNYTQVTWDGGSVTKTASGGDIIRSDEVTLLAAIPATGGWIRVRGQIVGDGATGLPYVNNTGNGVGTNTLLMSDEGVQTYTDTSAPNVSMGAGSITPTSSGLITPQAIWSTDYNGDAWYICGDSIALGYGDTVEGSIGDAGTLARSIGKMDKPYINGAVSSERGWRWLLNNAKRLDIARHCNKWATNFGGNDFTKSPQSDGAALQTMIVSVQAAFVAAGLGSAGIVSNVIPNASGTFASAAGQTVHANNSARVSYNAALPGLASANGFLFADVNALFEDPANLGKWISSPQYTTDGGHPSRNANRKVRDSSAVTSLIPGTEGYYATSFAVANQSLDALAGWTRVGGAAGDGSVVAEAASSNTADGGGAVYQSPVPGTGNDIYAEASFVSGVPRGLVAVRAADNANYMGVRSNSDTVEGYSRKSAVSTAAGTGSSAFSAASVLGIAIRGSGTLTTYVNGKSLFSNTPADPPAANRFAGLVFRQSTGAQFDNYSAGPASRFKLL